MLKKNKDTQKLEWGRLIYVFRFMEENSNNGGEVLFDEIIDVYFFKRNYFLESDNNISKIG